MTGTNLINNPGTGTNLYGVVPGKDPKEIMPPPNTLVSMPMYDANEELSQMEESTEESQKKIGTKIGNKPGTDANLDRVVPGKNPR